jgi:multiple antibiotic resistance protein
MNLNEFTNHLVALLVISNPFSALTAVIRVTRSQTVAQKKNTAVVTTIAIAVIMLVATWIGTPLLAILGIKLPAFQVAGSIVLLFMAFSMLYAEESPMKQTAEEQKERTPARESGAIVPLAIPIIAGPGTITSLIVSVNLNPGMMNQIFITIAALLVTLILFLILYFSSYLENIIGQRGINIFNRIAGLILAAIAIQSLAAGAVQLLPGWGGIPEIRS